MRENNMIIELTEQEADFIKEYFQQELENETLSNFSKKIMINIIQKLHD